MRYHLMQRLRRGPLAAVLAVLLAIGTMTGISVALTSGTAAAGTQTCTTPNSPVTCSLTIPGTLTLNPGQLELTATASLNWTAQVTGYTTYIADTTAGDNQITVDDATGALSGWHLSAAWTSFSPTLSGTALTFNGSSSDQAASSGPSFGCVVTNECTAATLTTVSYPVTVGATSTDIVDAASATGVGANVTSNAYWWVDIPYDAAAGTYRTNVTLAVTSGP